MSGPDLTDGVVAVGGALVAAFLSGRQYSYNQLAGQAAPPISRGTVVAVACVAAAMTGIGGDETSDKLLAFGVGSGAAEVGRIAFQKGAAGVGPNVSGRQAPGLLDGMMQRVRALMAPQQQRFNPAQHQYSNAL
jgi:hypothetical protein